jgi:hypothetical protein
MSLKAIVLTSILGFAAAASASAAPAISNTKAQNPNIIQVAGGCGSGFHPTPWACVPNRYAYGSSGYGYQAAPMVSAQTNYGYMNRTMPYHYSPYGTVSGYPYNGSSSGSGTNAYESAVGTSGHAPLH